MCIICMFSNENILKTLTLVQSYQDKFLGSQQSTVALKWISLVLSTSSLLLLLLLHFIDSHYLDCDSLSYASSKNYWNTCLVLTFLQEGYSWEMMGTGFIFHWSCFPLPYTKVLYSAFLFLLAQYFGGLQNWAWSNCDERQNRHGNN